jgi:hypothetical protein
MTLLMTSGVLKLSLMLEETPGEGQCLTRGVYLGLLIAGRVARMTMCTLVLLMVLLWMLLRGGQWKVIPRGGETEQKRPARRTLTRR